MQNLFDTVWIDFCDFLCAMPLFFNCLKTAFFRQHGCSTNDTNAKYNSRAAQMYREKIRQQANAAMSKYGTDVSLSEVNEFGLVV